MDKITAIVTCYKEKVLLIKAIDSLYAQTDSDFDIILVNDCSPDFETNLICEELSKRDRITLIINKKNLGLSGARNVGFQSMTGDIAVLLDADDELPPDTIANIRNSFKINPNAEFIFGNYKQKDVESGVERIIDCSVMADKENKLNPSYLCNKEWILLGTSPCRKSLWEKVGGYSMKYSNTCQDIFFWRNAMLKNALGMYTENIIYCWNKSALGMNGLKSTNSTYTELNKDTIDFFLKFGNRRRVYSMLDSIHGLYFVKFIFIIKEILHFHIDKLFFLFLTPRIVKKKVKSFLFQYHTISHD